MGFGSIDSFVWFGAGKLLLDSAVDLAREGFSVTVFSSDRHLREIVDGSTTLAEALDSAGIAWSNSADINADPRLWEHVRSTTLGIAMGPAWIFRKPVCDLFGHRLVNFMGINLPRMRGGAHYTWQLLSGDRAGACNLQLINEVVDSGAVVMREEYEFPAEARTPQDFFDFAGPIERRFLGKFLQAVKARETFNLFALNENDAQYFPYLNTVKQGLINWDWAVEEIERFISAFGRPYPGASSYLDGAKVFLHDARVEKRDGKFHPFMAGLIYAGVEGGVRVVARGGTLVISRIVDENGNDVTRSIRVGRRFHTPRAELDSAMAVRTIYTSAGLKTS